MKNKLLFFLVAASMLITGCDKHAQKNQCLAGGAGDTLLATPYTDKLEFAQANSLEGKRFASTSTNSSSFDHYGYVTLRSVTDGDTHFQSFIIFAHLSFLLF